MGSQFIRYDLVAKASRHISEDGRLAMVRDPLTSRFGLKAHYRITAAVGVRVDRRPVDVLVIDGIERVSAD